MQTNNESMQVIRFTELNNLLGGITKRTLLRWEAIGKFPKRIKLGERSVGWLLEDIKKWLSSKNSN